MMPVQTPIPSDVTIGHAVKIELAKQRWSGNRAAAELGWTQGYMSRRTTGKQEFGLRDLAQLAALLEMSTDELIRRVMESTDSVDYASEWGIHVRTAVA